MSFSEAIVWVEAHPVMASFAVACIGGIGWFLNRIWPAKSDHPKNLPIPQSDETRKDFIAALERQLEHARADLKEERADKDGLLKTIGVLEEKLRNPDQAFTEAIKTSEDTRARLMGLSNEVDADKLQEAQEAATKFDYAKADAIFADIAARNELAIAQTASAEFGRGEIAEAEIRWHDAYAHFKRAYELGKDVEALKAYARMAWRLGFAAEGVPLHELLVQIMRTTHGEQSTEHAIALNNLAELYRAQGRSEEAERLYKQAIDIGRKTIGKDHPDFAKWLNNLALLYYEQGRYDEAEALYKQAIEIDRKTIGEDHPEFATRLNNLAGLYKVQGRYDEAEALYTQAIEIERKTIGEDHPGFAISLNNLALLYEAQGRYDEAEALYTQAIEIGRKTIGEDHPGFAKWLNNLAGLYEEQGRYDEAEALYTQAIEIGRKTIGEDHPDFATRLNNLAFLYYEQGRYNEALPLIDQAVAIFEAKLPEGHPHIKIVRNGQAAIRAALRGE